MSIQFTAYFANGIWELYQLQKVEDVYWLLHFNQSGNIIRLHQKAPKTRSDTISLEEGRLKIKDTSALLHYLGKDINFSRKDVNSISHQIKASLENLIP